MNEKRYRIVCEYPSDQWRVDELVEFGWDRTWWEAHRCEAKGKEGYEEAKQWIEKQPE